MERKGKNREQFGSDAQRDEQGGSQQNRPNQEDQIRRGSEQTQTGGQGNTPEETTRRTGQDVNRGTETGENVGKRPGNQESTRQAGSRGVGETGRSESSGQH